MFKGLGTWAKENLRNRFRIRGMDNPGRAEPLGPEFPRLSSI